MAVSIKAFVTTFLGTLLACLLALSSAYAQPFAVEDAKKKPKKPKVAYINPNDVFSVDVKIGKGKKAKEVPVQCFQSTPGTLRTTAKGSTFTTYKKSMAQLRAKGRQNTKNYKKMAELSRLGNKSCKNPAFLGLDKYKGAFGEREARIIFERFAFAGSSQDIQAAVARGLDATVTMLTTYRPEPGLDAQVADLNCDTYFAVKPWDGKADTRNESCNPANRNDVDPTGVRYGLLWRMTKTQNPFFDRFWFWLHDERLAVSSQVLSGGDRFALIDYVSMLDRAARSGDYTQYMRDWNSSQLGNLIWLDGGSNKNYSPNENYAREFWELGTIGPADLNGNPNYGSYDIAQAALAHTGWTLIWEQIEIPGETNDVYFRFPAYSQALHAAGTKTIFSGTPYAASVDTAEDVLRATFAHPRTAEHLAEDLCHQFLMPECPAPLIRKLAASIRAANYNLLPVFRQLMTSRAIFADDNRRVLVKHPIELIVGFARQTNFPFTPEELDYLLRELDERPLLPETVFGWNEQRLAGESYVLAWRNDVLRLMGNWYNPRDLKEDRNYDMHTQFVANLPSGQSSSLALIDKISSLFNVPLNADQKASLDQYLNFERHTCQNWNVREYGCTPGQPFLERSQFDAFQAGNWPDKLQGLMAIVLMLPEYRTK